MLLIFPLGAKEYQFDFGAINGNTRGDVQPLLITAVQLVERGHHVSIFTDKPNQTMITDFIEDYFRIPAENDYTSVTSDSLVLWYKENLVDPSEGERIEIPYVMMTYDHKEIESNVFGALHIFSSLHHIHSKVLIPYFFDADKLARTGDKKLSYREDRVRELMKGINLFGMWSEKMDKVMSADKQQVIRINFHSNPTSTLPIRIFPNAFPLNDPDAYDKYIERAKQQNSIFFAVSRFATPAHAKYKDEDMRKGSIFPTYQQSHPLQEDLQAWIEEHQNIIVVAMGSMNLACFTIVNHDEETNPVSVSPVLDSIDALLNLDTKNEYSVLFIVNNPEDQKKLQDHFETNHRVFSSLPVSFQALFNQARKHIALFCSHGGAGSVVESLSFRIPNMVFAYMHDQPMNGQFIADNKLGSYVQIKDIINGTTPPHKVAEEIKTTI
jgi:hypothetical protein